MESAQNGALRRASNGISICRFASYVNLPAGSSDTPRVHPSFPPFDPANESIIEASIPYARSVNIPAIRAKNALLLGLTTMSSAEATTRRTSLPPVMAS